MATAKGRDGMTWVVVAAAIVSVTLTACARDPKDDALAYLTDLKLFNYPACYRMLSRNEQLERSIEQFLTEIPMAPDVSRDWFKPIELKVEYIVGQPKVNNDRAVVPVKVTMPDLALWERTLNAEQGKDPIEARAQKSLRENHYPKLVFDDEMVMVQESGEWKVIANFPQKERASRLHREAVELYHRHDFDQSIARYNALLDELEKQPATGNRGLAYRYRREMHAIEKARAQLPEERAYASKLVLRDVGLKMTLSQLPGIFGKISNTGGKPVDEVQVTVTYYLGKGKKRKAVFSEQHTPIATPLEFTNFDREVVPLAPSQTRDFGFKLTAPPGIQQTAVTDVAVTMVSFSQIVPPNSEPPRSEKAQAPAPAAAPAAVPAAAPDTRPEALPPPLPKG